MSIHSRDVSAIYELLYNPRYAPRSSPYAHVEELTVDGKPTFILMNESEREYYEIDATTNAIWRLMDGRRTLSEIYGEAKKQDVTLTEKGVRDVIISLAEEGTVESTEPEIERKRIEVISAFQLDIHLIKDSSKSLARLFGVTRRLFKKQALPIVLGISVLGVILFYGTFVRLFADTSVFEVAGSTLLGLLFYQLIVMSPVYAIHELCHAAACDHYGGKPRELGTGLYYLDPFFYCDTSDSWRLSRYARIMISLAGPLSTVVIASLLVFWSLLVPPGFGRNLLEIGAFFGYYGTLLNFSPVIETDGYYILADVLNIPNLRDESFSYVRRGILRGLGRSVSAVRQSARQRRIFLVYAVISVAWLAFFGYTTLKLLYVYGPSVYGAVQGLASTILLTQAFDLAGVTVDLAALAYFGLIVAGFVVMGGVTYRNIRMKGAKIETVHDKRVSAFLPVPSFISRSRAASLVEGAKREAGKFSRSFSVTLEPPLCVAALKLGKVEEALDSTRRDMLRVEQAFRSLHFEFLSKNLTSGEDYAARKMRIANSLIDLAKQSPPSERSGAVAAISRFLKRQDELIEYLIQSAFGTVWTLELTPDDYRRIRREIFPSSMSEDLGGTDLPGELESFKKHTILGTDAIAQLSSEIEEESKEVYKKPEVYQITAFFEPIKSRLVFVGRTEGVQGSIVWLGALFLYQAWTGYMSEVLGEAALGLKSIRLSPSHFIGKSQVSKLADRELNQLERTLGRMGKLAETVDSAIAKARSTFDSAKNFHETLTSLVSDETFDIGLYTPILRTNEKRLQGVSEGIDRFQEEFGRVAEKLERVIVAVKEERANRALEKAHSKQSPFRRFQSRMFSSIQAGLEPRRHSSTYYNEVKLVLSVSRLTYGVVMASDIVL